MLLEEWDLDTALKVEREEGWEQGLEQGLEKGLERGRAEEHRNTLAVQYQFEAAQREIEHLRAQLGR